MCTVDMHVHTCLSPCGDLEMHPSAIVREAIEAGLDGVVICDHNATDNVEACARAAGAAGCIALPGMEVTTEEEVHLVALLPDAAAAGVLHARAAAALPAQPDEPVFGRQVIADERATVLGFNQSCLSAATRWPLERAVDEIHRAGGLAIAAHVDRERFGLIGQLGFVPEGLPLDGIEVSRLMAFDEARLAFGVPLGLPVVTGSDAHAPGQVGRAVTFFHLDCLNGMEVAAALRGEGGRSVLGGGRPMEDLALHILDIAQNSLEAGATHIRIDLEEDRGADRLVIRVSDNGRGMDEGALRRATDPFFTTRTTRSVGLGLALLKQAAEAAGGGLEIESQPGVGTRVRAMFELGHPDRAPVGDIESTVLVLAASRPDADLVFTHRAGDHEFSLASADVRAALDGLPISSPEGLAVLREAMRAGEGRLAAARRTAR